MQIGLIAVLARDRVQVQRRYRDPPNADVCAAGDVYTISDADVVACNCLRRGRRSGSSMQASAEPPRPEEADHPLNVAALAVARDAVLDSNGRSHHTCRYAPTRSTSSPG